MKHILIAALTLLPIFSYASEQSAIALALAQASRPPEDKTADGFRHPKELVEFSQLKTGETVLDIIPGKGYFARLFISVVGPKGKYIGYVPKEVENSPYKIVEGAKGAVVGAKNASVVVVPTTEQAAENVDLIWISQNYHDFHVPSFIKMDVPAFNKIMFKMLRPGGRIVIVDHVAAAGSDDAVVEKLHRIDPAVVRKELEAAGFVFDAESAALKQKDDHKLNVFDPAIRGKTDQFTYRFIKPKK